MRELRIWVFCDTRKYRVGMGPCIDFVSLADIRPAWEAAGRCPIRFQQSGMTCDVIDDGVFGRPVRAEGFISNAEFRKHMRTRFWKVAGLKPRKHAADNN